MNNLNKNLEKMSQRELRAHVQELRSIVMPKPPFPDVDDITDDAFCGVAWTPTCKLRFVERVLYNEAEGKTNKTARILQQQWETVVINHNSSRFMWHVNDPQLTEWRDVPMEIE